MSEVINEEVKQQTIKPKVVDNGIDKDILELMMKEDVIGILGDNYKINRGLLNYEAESLREIKELRQTIEEFERVFTIANNEALAKYFETLGQNMKNEKNKQVFLEKVKKSHKKTSKK